MLFAMWWTRTEVAQPTQGWASRVATLEDNAARARAALGCSYSSSAEYEAELIAERRAAGAYGRPRTPWVLRACAAATGLAVVVVLIFVLR